MEQLTIHSKDYLVRWINIPAFHSVSWSLTPKSHSVQFGVFKHPGNSEVTSRPLPTTSDSDPAPAVSSSDSAKPRRASSTVVDHNAREKLERLGIKCVAWIGKCDADRVSTGRYDVTSADEAGMYGLVFDNTYSKTVSKHVTFVLITHLTSATPKNAHQLHFTQVTTRKSSGGNLKRLGNSKPSSPALTPIADNESPFKDVEAPGSLFEENRPTSARTKSAESDDGNFYNGILSKKRRKRNQGYARRFFSLDFTTATLSYYKNRHSPALRGAVPLQLAAIGANEKSRQISIDSGAEVWLLRASNQKAFAGWRAALERACAASEDVATSERTVPVYRSSPIEEKEWGRVELLVGRITSINDSVKQLAKDTDPKYLPSNASAQINASLQPSPKSAEGEGQDYLSAGAPTDRPSFWRRKSSSFAVRRHRSPSGQRSVSKQRVTPHASSKPLSIPRSRPTSSSSAHDTAIDDVHDRCMAILRDLDGVITDFTSLLGESKKRRTPAIRPPIEQRHSFESVGSTAQEFFDAPDGGADPSSQLLTIRDDEHSPSHTADDAASLNSSTSSVDDEEHEAARFDTRDTSHDQSGEHTLLPAKPRNLHPLPLKNTTPVHRRSAIPPSAANPPSLIGFLRKNVGKDLSTIAMPVTANEPLSLLQRQAEMLEYSHLLDSAASFTPSNALPYNLTPSDAPALRILYLAAFALSSLSNTRDRARATRKPFNPMLGETFELVREDLGYRFLAEKVSHRPVRVASSADSLKGWSFVHSPAPDQKFWGKSAELVTDGRARVSLHHSSLQECYTWQPPTCFLRNVLAGEKYVEPVGDMSLLCETSGWRALATFKAGGMFSGRSEEVTVVAYDPAHPSTPHHLGLTGKWTSQLDLVSSSSGEILEEGLWRASPLVDQPGRHFGLTKFAATLNEITSTEKGALPPTDSRLRPDQRAYEEGDVTTAENLKGKLEENQRRRRKEMEEQGEGWQPRWFERLQQREDGVQDGSEEVWTMKDDEAGTGYWDVRDAVVGFKGGVWDGVRNVFETG